MAVRTLDHSMPSGDAIFARSDGVGIEVGGEAVVGLLAYSGARGPIPNVLHRFATRLIGFETRGGIAEAAAPCRNSGRPSSTERKARDEVTPARCVHRQLSSAPLRHRNFRARSHTAIVKAPPDLETYIVAMTILAPPTIIRRPSTFRFAPI